MEIPFKLRWWFRNQTRKYGKFEGFILSLMVGLYIAEQLLNPVAVGVLLVLVWYSYERKRKVVKPINKRPRGQQDLYAEKLNPTGPPACIESIGTAHPDLKLTIAESAGWVKSDVIAWQFRNRPWSASQNIRDLWDMLVEVLGVTSKYHILHPREIYGSGKETEKAPTCVERHEIWKTKGWDYAMKAVRNALKGTEYEKNPEKITHVVAHSCTGSTYPGLTARIVNDLGLKDDVRRIECNYMGCFGTFTLLKVARSIVQADNNAVVLCCAIEASSTQGCFDELHNEVLTEIDKHRAFGWSLFADGSSAYVVTNKGKIQFCCDGGGIIEGTELDMIYEPRWNNYICNISRHVPRYTADSIRDILKTLPHKDLQFMIHPGGKKIIDYINEVIQEYGIKPVGIQDCLDVLDCHGNCSSATVGFVMQEVLKKNYSQQNFFSAGFGPGLTTDWFLGKRSDGLPPAKAFVNDNKAFISCLVTGVPPQQIDTTKQVNWIKKDIIKAKLKNESDKQISLWDKAAKEVNVKKKHTIIPDMEKFYTNKAPQVLERNRLWQKECFEMVDKTVKELAKQWGGNVKEITHVVSQCSTAWYSPGITVTSMKALGISAQRVEHNFSGHIGGYAVLRTAQNFVKANPKNKVLCIVAESETVQLDFQSDFNASPSEKDRLRAQWNLSAGDGCAAFIVENKGSIEIVSEGSITVPNTMDLFTKNSSIYNYVCEYSPKANEHAKRVFERIIKEYKSKNLLSSDIKFCVNGNGLENLTDFENVLKNQKVNVAGFDTARKIYENYGDLQSPAFLFILKELIKNSNSSDILAVGVGPGVTLEHCLLRKL